MKAGFAIAILMSTLFSLPAFADDKPQAAVNASNKDDFQTVSGWVSKQMEPGGRYSYVTSRERARVKADLDGMDRLFQEHGDVAHMQDADKTQMFNHQEEVNAILAKRDNDRLICKNEMPIGSHIPVKTCQTAGSIEARRRNDVEYLKRTSQTRPLNSNGT